MRGNCDGTGLELTENWEDDICVVVDDCVGKVFGSSVDHVEGVQLTDGGLNASDGHRIVAFGQQSWVTELEDDHIVDVVQLIQRVQNCSVLFCYLDFESRDLFVHIAQILTDYKGELFIFVERARKVELDGHGVGTEGIEV